MKVGIMDDLVQSVGSGLLDKRCVVVGVLHNFLQNLLYL